MNYELQHLCKSPNFIGVKKTLSFLILSKTDAWVENLKMNITCLITLSEDTKINLISYQNNRGCYK